MQVQERSAPSNHIRFMLLSDMRIDFQQQRTVVLMPKPPGNGTDVYAGLKASCSEKMTQCVGGETRNPEFLARARDKALCFFDEQGAIFGCNFFSLGLPAPGGSRDALPRSDCPASAGSTPHETSRTRSPRIGPDG